MSEPIRIGPFGIFANMVRIFAVFFAILGCFLSGIGAIGLVNGPREPVILIPVVAGPMLLWLAGWSWLALRRYYVQFDETGVVIVMHEEILPLASPVFLVPKRPVMFGGHAMFGGNWSVNIENDGETRSYWMLGQGRFITPRGMKHLRTQLQQRSIPWREI